jgi:hypothetical protein
MPTKLEKQSSIYLDTANLVRDVVNEELTQNPLSGHFERYGDIASLPEVESLFAFRILGAYTLPVRTSGPRPSP